MDCRIDRALRTMFLRRKLRLIEARRKKYPATFDARKQYIQDSLKEKYTCKIAYWLLMVIGIVGMILSLIWCFKGTDFKGSFLGAVLSMLLFAAGVLGIENREI